LKIKKINHSQIFRVYAGTFSSNWFCQLLGHHFVRKWRDESIFLFTFALFGPAFRSTKIALARHQATRLFKTLA